ncbi:hypothetical protein DCS_03811 [Drechmeria coniospora]|uniref:Uncharacterized protein n=1 Tax=Drechmeria coniospora TaxID=98403 RepID=A0A151GI64_DRECN|nr:hypothetical protein DCS_03811 [Drechmeria coniospora]KYK56805.1 hypothetical protein DCS_03811 [Drechmeria coniospora]
MPSADPWPMAAFSIQIGHDGRKDSTATLKRHDARSRPSREPEQFTTGALLVEGLDGKTQKREHWPLQVKAGGSVSFMRCSGQSGQGRPAIASSMRRCCTYITHEYLRSECLMCVFRQQPHDWYKRQQEYLPGTLVPVADGFASAQQAASSDTAEPLANDSCQGSRSQLKQGEPGQMPNMTGPDNVIGLKEGPSTCGQVSFTLSVTPPSYRMTGLVLLVSIERAPDRFWVE